ncbi:hypothetical protein BJ741DRAFT_24131 [Chytriomyces cf. hyalinus JEL632]|nr:hypothetical protein BJ741DRAFT_24131 [Chytriomyces cf. hyalinus JEL632]
MRCRKKENGVVCNGECEQAESRTEANPGRLFWRCTKGHGWNGWVPAGQQQQTQPQAGSSSSSQRYTPYATPTTPVRAQQQQPRAAAPSSPTPAPRTTVPPPYSIMADRQTPPASQIPMGDYEEEEDAPQIGDQISAVLDPVSTLLAQVLNENKTLKEANTALVAENEALKKKVRILAQAVDS